MSRAIDPREPAAQPPPTPHAARLGLAERLISRLLRLGVAASLVLVTAGTLISFVHHPDYVSEPPALLRLTTPGAAFPHTLAEVMRGLRDGRGQSVVLVGLLLLIATPVARVAASVIVFVVSGDRTYVAITLVVLALLLLSFAIGRVVE